MSVSTKRMVNDKSTSLTVSQPASMIRKRKGKPASRSMNHNMKEWIRTNASIFDAMKDEDFFSNKVVHIYFQGTVTQESVTRLLKDIRNANRSSPNDPSISTRTDIKIETPPRPIVIHINSRGGRVIPSLRFFRAFQESRVPICTMIDGVAMSSATVLAIASPYRIMTESSYALLHQYFAFIIGTATDIQERMEWIKQMDDYYINLYLQNTNYTPSELKELMGHDYLLPSKVCLEKGVVDRIIRLNKPYREWLPNYVKKSPYYDIPSPILMKKTNLNTIYFECENTVPDLNVLLETSLSNPIKPILIYVNVHECNLEVDSISEMAMICTRIQAFRVPTYCIIDGYIDIMKYYPMLFCMKRIMYSNVILRLNIHFFRTDECLLEDTIRNTHTLLEPVLERLRMQTTLPESILENMTKKQILLTAQECLKYKLCDEIIPQYN